MATINFDNNALWIIRLFISKPYEKENIPAIDINFITGREKVASVRKKYGDLITLKALSDNLLLSINVKYKIMSPIRSDRNKYYGKLEEEYSISTDNYKKSIRDIFTTLFEYQIIELTNQ